MAFTILAKVCRTGRLLLYPGFLLTIVLCGCARETGLTINAHTGPAHTAFAELEILMEEGLSEQEWEQLLTDNPRNAYTIGVRKLPSY